MLRLMGRHHILPVHQGLALAYHRGARIVACSNTVQLLGLGREDLIGEVNEIAGALTFQDAADEGTVVTLS
jgi:peroxiredoxin family protein